MKTMKEKYNIISIGRSLVDVTFTLEDDIYKDVLTFLGVYPGDWTEIVSIEQLKYIFELVSGFKYPIVNESDILFLKNSPQITIEAGSTNLNVLSTFPLELRKKSAIVTAIGVDENNKKDLMSMYYTESLSAKSINHIHYSYLGNNPLSLVFISKTNPEKVMASFLGISGNLDKMLDIDTEYIYIDAYELQKGPISKLLDTLILSKKYKIALGLGNATILEGQLLYRIQEYLSDGAITILLGNVHEYRKLFSPLNIGEIASIPLFSKTPYMLLTQGENELIGIINGKVYTHNAFKISKISNTTGAGDTAAGAFISSIIQNKTPKDIVYDAAYMAYVFLKQREL